MAYDVSDHPLLGEKGKQLYAKNSDAFEQHQAVAIERLGLGPDTSYTFAQRQSLLRYIAIQVNWQLDVPKTAAWLKQESSSQTKQNLTYRDGIPLVSPEAALGIAEIIGGGLWGSITSVRRAVR